MDPKDLPAFPELQKSYEDRHDGGTFYESAGGLSKREYFAAKVLQGLCANPAVFAANGVSGWSLVNCSEDQLTDLCALLADKLMASLA